MDYNTTRKKLTLPEYGRNVLKMVQHAIDLETKEERNRAAKSIITVMGNKYPHLRDVNDFKHKLWDHLALMSDFNLDIDAPYPATTLEKLSERPERLPYNSVELKYRHYGRIIIMLIDKVSNLEESEEKNTLIKTIVNHMRKTYYGWHNEHVSNETIFDTIYKMSNGKLKIDSSFKLDFVRDTGGNSGGRRKKNLRRDKGKK